MERYRGKTGDDITLDPDGDIVLYADAQAAIAALQAERDTARRRVDELEAREVDVVMLREDLEQRTAELEAANKLLYRKNCELGRAETIINEAQAELEAAKRERDHAKKMEAVQKEVADNQTWHVQRLKAELERVRGLVKTYAAAKIDFDDKRLQEDHHAWKERYNKLVEAENALLQHRQRMEG